MATMVSMSSMLFNYTFYSVSCVVLLVLMFICALFALIVILFQPGNSTGIDALSGSSETFFGKNKGRSIESKLKMLTYISLGILAVLSIAFFLLQLLA